MPDEFGGDCIGGFPVVSPNCAGCGKPLTIENAWMTDGCPCNTPLGVNSMNETRWRLLQQLQQQQSRELAKLRNVNTAKADASEPKRQTYGQAIADAVEWYCDAREFADTSNRRPEHDAKAALAREIDEMVKFCVENPDPVMRTDAGRQSGNSLGDFFMHYRNGREAFNGDKCVKLEGGGQYGPVKIVAIGVLFDAKPGNDCCNGSIASTIGGPVVGACLCDMIHTDDLSAILTEKGLDKCPAGK